MEELSRINLNLATQLSRMQQPYITLKTLIVSEQGDLDPLAVTPLENILNTTRHFLDILSLIAGSAQFSLSPTSNSSNSLQLSTIYSEKQNSSASISVSRDDSCQSWSDSSPSSSQPSDTSSLLKACPDIALLLLILICYIHVLRLHVALFAHIELYL